MAVVWESRLDFGPLTASLEAAAPVALERGAEYVRSVAIPKVPFIEGSLRSSGGTRHTGSGLESAGEVSFNTVYAAFQEYGSWPDGSHVVKRHTEPGTQTHFLRDAMIEGTDGALEVVAEMIRGLL